MPMTKAQTRGYKNGLRARRGLRPRTTWPWCLRYWPVTSKMKSTAFRGRRPTFTLYERFVRWLYRLRDRIIGRRTDTSGG